MNFRNTLYFCLAPLSLPALSPETKIKITTQEARSLSHRIEGHTERFTARLWQAGQPGLWAEFAKGHPRLAL